ncbi:hypothetical protein VNO77_04541 [Canavalia gladiata]|uniref:Uncharacterized protein n=1 Tax=Canavalia gladiata TaxID=3824 RepID=A0AAN9MWQ3_CANGL
MFEIMGKLGDRLGNLDFWGKTGINGKSKGRMVIWLCEDSPGLLHPEPPKLALGPMCTSYLRGETDHDMTLAGREISRLGLRVTNTTDHPRRQAPYCVS